MKSKLEQFVIDRQGKWFSSSECFKSGLVAAFTSSGGEVTQISVDDIGAISSQEFEACAKRLGYINGYRWGVEYPTNGKRPELADGLVVVRSDSRLAGCFGGEVAASSDMDWTFTVAFKITDPRYKPADTSYLNVQPQDHIVEVNENVDNSWHERGELPPVGVKAYFINNPAFVSTSSDRSWHDGDVLEVLGYAVVGGEKVCVVFNLRDETAQCLVPSCIIPIRTEREKFIDDAWGKLRGDTPHKETTELIGQLYDLGYRLPVDK